MRRKLFLSFLVVAIGVSLFGSAVAGEVLLGVRVSWGYTPYLDRTAVTSELVVRIRLSVVLVEASFRASGATSLFETAILSTMPPFHIGAGIVCPVRLPPAGHRSLWMTRKIGVDVSASDSLLLLLQAETGAPLGAPEYHNVSMKLGLGTRLWK